MIQAIINSKSATLFHFLPAKKCQKARVRVVEALGRDQS
jgi:hypothetical protein